VIFQYLLHQVSIEEGPWRLISGATLLQALREFLRDRAGAAPGLPGERNGQPAIVTIPFRSLARRLELAVNEGEAFLQ
jgi:hypothetical protein